jgi:hypothetical protein
MSPEAATQRELDACADHYLVPVGIEHAGHPLAPGLAGRLIDDLYARGAEPIDRSIAVIRVDPHRESLAAGPLWCVSSCADPEMVLPDPDRDEDRIAIGGEPVPDLSTEEPLVEAEQAADVPGGQDRERRGERHNRSPS